MGRRTTLRKGSVQQWQCSHCGRWGSESPDPYHSLFPGFRYRLASESLLKALALLVVGAPMDWIQARMKIKSETVKKHFSLLVAYDRWEALKTDLERVGVPKRQLDQFDEDALESQLDAGFFRGRGQRFRRMSAGERKKVACLASRILGRAVSFSRGRSS